MQLPISTMRYDITMPLLDGRVEIPGVELAPTGTGAMVFNEVPALLSGDFGLWDLNLGYVLPAIEAGWEIVGLPLMVKRKPVYTFVFARADSGIETPKDLEGKRIGSGSYPTSITVWTAGLLQHRHGVDISKLVWMVSNNRRVFPLHVDRPVVMPSNEATDGAGPVSPIDRLMAGEVDAIITDISDGPAFQMLESSPEVKRVFPNYQDEDLALWRESGIHTPMHQMVMSRKLDREDPELGRRVFDAFVEAKRLADIDAVNDRAGFSVMYQRELVEEQKKVWGDNFIYGVKDDMGTLDAFLTYNVEQGLTRQRLSLEDWMAASTLDT